MPHELRKEKGRPRIAGLRAAACVVTILACAAASSARADSLAHDAARREVEAGRALPLSTVVQKAQEAFKGRLLGADLVRPGDGAALTYSLRLLSEDGRMARVTVAASDGHVLSVQGGGSARVPSGSDSSRPPPAASRAAAAPSGTSSPATASSAPLRAAPPVGAAAVRFGGGAAPHPGPVSGKVDHRPPAPPVRPMAPNHRAPPARSKSHHDSAHPESRHPQ